MSWSQLLFYRALTMAPVGEAPVTCMGQGVTHNKLMHSKIVRTVAALSVLGILLAGCSSEQSVDSAEMPADSQTSAEMADIAFAQMMILHHEQAIVMSEYALANTDSPQVLELAEEILAAQGPEIEQMTAILDRFKSNMGGHEGHSLAGMLAQEELAQLQSARGPEFDQLFFTTMIAHHKGAINMAQEILASGSDSEVRTLAEQIVVAQQAEIDMMQKMQAN